MCRWISLLSSEKVSLADLVLEPENSLIKMSYKAGYHPGFGPENNSVFNGDGFGIGWSYKKKYSGELGLAIFKDVLPAWSDSNLQEVCSATESRCIIAHVRAASPGSGVSRENCHPFKAGRLLFCHNGRIDAHWAIRKHMLNDLTDAAYRIVRGTTDSEVAFAMILSELEKDGCGGDSSPYTQKEPFEAERLVSAVRKTIEKIEEYHFTLKIPREQSKGYSTLNFSLTDGETLVVTRYCDQHPKIPAPSLYFAYDKASKLRETIARSGGSTSIATGQSAGANHHGPGDGSENNIGSGNNPANSSSGLDSNTTITIEGQGDVMVDVIKRSISYQHLTSFVEQFKDINHDEMAFCVSSDPLTFCDMWQPIPGNSIISYKVGQRPDCILLSFNHHHATIVSPEDIVHNKSADPKLVVTANTASLKTVPEVHACCG